MRVILKFLKSLLSCSKSLEIYLELLKIDLILNFTFLNVIFILSKLVLKD